MGRTAAQGEAAAAGWPGEGMAGTTTKSDDKGYRARAANEAHDQLTAQPCFQANFMYSPTL